MSERQRLRFGSGHFIKYHGRQSQGEKLKQQDLNLRAEDMVCEWQVEKVKNSLRTLGGNYTESTIEKKTKATALISAIMEHDNKSLLVETASGPGTSWKRFEDEEIQRFRDYVKSLRPFRLVKTLKNLNIDYLTPGLMRGSLFLMRTREFQGACTLNLVVN
jgi:hypothetical protein